MSISLSREHLRSPFKTGEGQKKPARGIDFFANRLSDQEHELPPVGITPENVLDYEGVYFATACTSSGTSATLDILSKPAYDHGVLIHTIVVSCHMSATGAIVTIKGNSDDSNYVLGLLSAITSTAHQTLSLNFSPIGLQLGTDTATTTSTSPVWIETSGATATVDCIVTGWKKA